MASTRKLIETNKVPLQKILLKNFRLKVLFLLIYLFLCFVDADLINAEMKTKGQ